MRFRPALLARITLVVLVPLTGLFASQESGSHSPAPADKRHAASKASLTGCVDEKEGRYVLVDDRNLDLVAVLEADGFPTESFAKHVGHKVTVKGTSSPGTTYPVFKVRSIETLSDTCAPTQQSAKH